MMNIEENVQEEENKAKKWRIVARKSSRYGKLVGAVWCWWYRQIAGNSILHKNQTGCDKIKPGKGVQHFIFFCNSDCEAKNWRRETERGRWLILLFCWIELVRNKNALCQVFFSHALQVEKTPQLMTCNFAIQQNTPNSFYYWKKVETVSR